MRNTLMIAAVASGLALSGCTTDPNTGQTITISDFVQDCNTPCALGLG